MDILNAFVVCFQTLFEAVSNIFSFTVVTVRSILSFNYTIISGLIWLVTTICSVVIDICKAVVSIWTSLVQCLGDFFSEIFQFICLIGTLAWMAISSSYRFVCGLFSILDATIFYFWTGSREATISLQKTITDFANLCGNLVANGKYLIVNLTTTVFGGFSAIGNGVVAITIGIYSSILYLATSSFNFVINAITELYNQIVYGAFYIFRVFIPNLSRESYLGILVCCLMYFIILSMLKYLHSRGLTFPFFSNRRSRRHIHHSEIEVVNDDLYSDNESNADIDNSDVSSNSDSSDESDRSSETDDSDASISNSVSNSVEDSDGEIDIQLPQPYERYNLRRSATPARFKKYNNDINEEIEYEVEKERDKRKCVVCQDQIKSVLILPCKHMCLCVECADQIARSHLHERRVCPLCRQRIQTIMNVYI